PPVGFAAALEELDGLMPYLPNCARASIACATHVAQGAVSLCIHEAAAAARESAAQAARVAAQAAQYAAARPYDAKRLTGQALIEAGARALAAARRAAEQAQRTEEEAQCALLRDIFGNPFRAPFRTPRTGGLHALLPVPARDPILRRRRSPCQVPV